VYTDGALMNPCDVKGESGNGEGKCGLWDERIWCLSEWRTVLRQIRWEPRIDHQHGDGWPLFLSFVVLGFKLRALPLRGRSSTTWAAPLFLFVLVVFWIGSCIFPWGWPGLCSPYLCFPCSWDDRHIPPCSISLFLHRLALNLSPSDLCLLSS
jgi:hypothetical protein